MTLREKIEIVDTLYELSEKYEEVKEVYVRLVPAFKLAKYCERGKFVTHIPLTPEN